MATREENERDIQEFKERIDANKILEEIGRNRFQSYGRRSIAAVIVGGVLVSSTFIDKPIFNSDEYFLASFLLVQIIMVYVAFNIFRGHNVNREITVLRNRREVMESSLEAMRRYIREQFHQ